MILTYLGILSYVCIKIGTCSYIADNALLMSDFMIHIFVEKDAALETLLDGRRSACY